MKSIILTLLLIYPFLLLSQTTGSITYTETLNLQIDLPEGMEQFKDMVPTSTKFQKVLLFNQEATLYKDAPVGTSEDAEIDMSDEEGGVRVKMDFSRPDNQLYYDVKSAKSIERSDFMDKKFLIEGTPKRYKWKMTGEQKTILDYTCQKAIFQDSSENIVAWFTTQIPVSAGPSSYAGLPGMVLEVDADEGQRKILATTIELKELEKGAIKAPKKGKKVTREEYEKIVDAKTKELQEEYGGSGNIIIKTTRGGN